MTTTTAASAPATTPASGDRVTVRMYQNLLGDCFLLRFPGTGRRPVHMLIDCGVLQGMPGAVERMQAIAGNIRDTLPKLSPKEGDAARPFLDVLVVTHEHWDHLSGISQAQEIWDGVDIGELWLGWTEDPTDPQAMELLQGRRSTLKMLEKVAAMADSGAAGVGLRSGAVRDLFAFIGPEEDSDEPAGDGSLGARASTTVKRIRTGAAILDYLRNKAGVVRYWKPGADPVPVPGTEGNKVYVLGPPRDTAMLRRSNPSKKGKEVYELGVGDGSEYLLGALEAFDGQSDPLSMPFAERYTVAAELIEDPTKAEPSDIPPSRRMAPKARQLLNERYYGKDEEWRRIDGDWLGAAEQLAIKLNNDTNNTSLVLALDVAPDDADGGVLLFPGDAQVGNWLSWNDCVWPAGAKREDAGTVTLERLLARTILYKVGHHGSHNATLRERGLELMTNRELVAMIPVVEKFAREKPLPWNMPFPALNQRLKERTRGRILRCDRGVGALDADRTDIGTAVPLTDAEWTAFAARVSEDEAKLYIEYSITR
ncbi:hypothetical protein [Azospirillum sp. sgz301742]